MGHKSFSEFFTDMKTDRAATIFVKVLLLIEILFNIIAGFLLLVWFRVNVPAGIQDAQLALVILVIAHLGTPLTLVDMLHKLEHRQSVAWLSMWWLIVATLLDIHSIIDAFQFPYATAVIDGGYRTYLMAAGFIFLATSVSAIIAFIWVKMSNADQSEETERTNASIIASEYSDYTPAYNGSGAVSVRFPIPVAAMNKISHVPARKAE